MSIKLRYDGKYQGFDLGPLDARSWTITNHFLDHNGCDRYKGTFGLEGLRELGVLK